MMSLTDTLFEFSRVRVQVDCTMSEFAGPSFIHSTSYIIGAFELIFQMIGLENLLVALAPSPEYGTYGIVR
jgi:hypothetical protein